MDDVDKAGIQQQNLIEKAVGRIRGKANVVLDGTGVCLECGRVVNPRMFDNKQILPRWCDDECRDAWER